MTELEARVLAKFLNKLHPDGGGPSAKVSDTVTGNWFVEFEGYIDEWPTDAIDDLFWSDEHQALVEGWKQEQA